MLCNVNERIREIRQLLSELEVELSARAPDGAPLLREQQLATVVQQIVDDLQPLLTPYDAAFYWFLFRHSIAKDGSPLLRVSKRHLGRAVVRSSYSQAKENAISPAKVQQTIRALESIGALRKEEEPNRDGTLYRVLVPSEIEACQRSRAERMAAEPELKFPNRGIEVG